MHYDVETFSLTKIFSDWWGRQKVCAVDNLNLKIQHNEVFGFLGPNGSGKTTTLKMLLGLLYPTKGRAVVLGGDSTDPKINSRIGFMPEESYLYRYLTARETLDFYGSLFGLPSQGAQDAHRSPAGYGGPKGCRQQTRRDILKRYGKKNRSGAGIDKRPRPFDIG